MKIETKYNIGDEVWVYLDEQCMKGSIIHFRIYIDKIGNIDIWYNVMFGYDDVCLSEKSLFPTKEELLKSL